MRGKKDMNKIKVKDNCFSALEIIHFYKFLIGEKNKNEKQKTKKKTWDYNMRNRDRGGKIMKHLGQRCVHLSTQNSPQWQFTEYLILISFSDTNPLCDNWPHPVIKHPSPPPCCLKVGWSELGWKKWRMWWSERGGHCSFHFKSPVWLFWASAGPRLKSDSWTFSLMHSQAEQRVQRLG